MKKVLVVVDYQNDFIDGSLGFPSAKNIKNNIIKWVKEFLNNDDIVIFTRDTHHENYLSTIEGKKLPIKHCIKGSSGHYIESDVSKLVGSNLVIDKNSFGSLELGIYLKDHKDEISDVYLCGLVSDICVFSNAVIAKSSVNNNSNIYIIKEASESYDKTLEEMAYKMAEHLHIEIIRK